MKIVTGVFSKKKWVVNREGVRVTPKYSNINITNYGIYSIVEGYYNHSKRKIRLSQATLFSTKNVRRIISYDIKEHKRVFDNVVALYFCNSWHFFNIKGSYLRGGIKQFMKCNDYPYIIAKIEDRWCFLDETMSVVSDGYAYAEDFDKYGYATVVGYLSQKKYIINSDIDIVCGPIQCDRLRAISNDLFVVNIAGHYGLVDRTNKEILPTIYDKIEKIDEYHFKVKKEGKYGLVDNIGKIILECYYDEIIKETDSCSIKAYAWYERCVNLESPNDNKKGETLWK